MATSKKSQPAGTKSQPAGKKTKPAAKAAPATPARVDRKPVVPARAAPAAVKATARRPAPAPAKPVHARPVAKQVRAALPPARSALRPGGKPPARTAPAAVKFSEKDMESFHRELLAMRERLIGQVGKMRQDALRRDDEVNTEEDGSDAFDRLFTLERAGSDQEIIFRINESLRAITENKYGTCESCGGLIEKPRLQALPFAKNCVTCQSEMERSRNGGSVRRHLP